MSVCSDVMAADIFTKQFTSTDKWVSVCSLIGVVPNTFIDNIFTRPRAAKLRPSVALCAVSCRRPTPPINAAALSGSCEGSALMSTAPTRSELSSDALGRAILLAILEQFSPGRAHDGRQCLLAQVPERVALAIDDFLAKPTQRLGTPTAAPPRTLCRHLRRQAHNRLCRLGHNLRYWA